MAEKETVANMVNTGKFFCVGTLHSVTTHSFTAKGKLYHMVSYTVLTGGPAHSIESFLPDGVTKDTFVCPIKQGDRVLAEVDGIDRKTKRVSGTVTKIS